MEETGLKKDKEVFKHVYTLNSVFVENNFHSISCCMYSEIEKGEKMKIKNAEPTKCAGWFWTSIKELRKNYNKLFYPIRTFLDNFPEMNDVNYIQKMIQDSSVKSDKT